MAEPLDMDTAKGSLGRAFDGVGRFARSASAQIVEQVSDLKTTVTDSVDKLTEKTPDPYEVAIADYNAAYTAMNDKGLSLLRQRERSTDVIELV